MASEGRVTGTGLWVSLGLVLLLQAGFELLPMRLPPATRMWLLGATRLLQTGAVFWAVRRFGGGVSSLGLSRAGLVSGLLRGVIWCFGFGAVAALGGLVLHFVHIDPFFPFRQPLPVSGPGHLLAYVTVGSLVAGLSEEVFFRGLVFGYLRRYGFLAALVASTLAFIAPHYLVSRGAAPLFQGLGGLLFAIAYEREKNLVPPMLLHAGGNFVLFALTIYFSGQYSWLARSLF